MRAAGFDSRYYDMRPCLLYERAAATLAGQEVDVAVSQKFSSWEYCLYLNDFCRSQGSKQYPKRAEDTLVCMRLD